MADAGALIAAISSISITLIKLLSTLSQFVDEVSQTPPDVQRLSNQLSNLYSSLGETKLALHRAHKPSLDQGDLDEKIQYMLSDCEEILSMLEKIVEKAKRKEIKYVGSTKWARVKFTFKEQQIDIISDRLTYYCVVLKPIRNALDQYDPHLRLKTEVDPTTSFEKMVDILKSNRAKFNFVLAALDEDKEDIPDIDYPSINVWSRPTSYQPSAAGPAGSSSSSSPRARSPFDAAMVPYRLTRDEVNAMADARSIRWELRHMEFNCQINQSRNRYLHYEGRKGGLIVRVETGPPLACTVRKFTDDHEVESYIYPVTWSDVSFDASNYSVSTASRNSKKLRDSSPGTETFTFDTRRDAMEFYQCLKVLIPLHRRSWKRAVVALGPVNTQYRIDTPEDLELSAEKLSRAVDLRQGSDRDSLEDVDRRLKGLMMHDTEN